MTRKKRILFVKLGDFSYTNLHVAEQLRRNFPLHDLMVVDVKTYAKSRPLAAAYNILTAAATFGLSVLRNRSDLHAYFFRTPFMFRHLHKALLKDVAPVLPDVDLVIQTQGLFNAKIPDKPLLIYTDYTYRDNLDSPDSDQRVFRSKKAVEYEAALYRSAAAVTTSGSHVEQTLIKEYGCDPARVSTIHIGTSVTIRPVSTDLARYSAKHVVFVGVEWERKGGPALVEGFLKASRKHPDARLTIVGCSPAVSHPQITVVGRVPPDDVAKYLEAASVFSTPSRVEPLGIAVIEASLFRLPVIATRIGGFYETVTDGETGFLVPVNDSEAISNALESLFESPARARQMGIAGFERNRTRFTWDEVGKRLRSVAETIVPSLQ